jgi:signal transduction histidine kinase
MLIDITCLTGGLFSAGGLAAAPYLGVYTFIPVYAAIVLSSTACFVATGVSTALYLAGAYLQHVGWIPLTVSSLPKNAWNIAAFNLLIINLVGALTAILAEAYRRSRTRLASLYQELERAHDESLRLNAEIQRASQLQMLAEVAGGVTHEIRNVLTAAFGHLEMARQKVRAAAPSVLPHLQQLQTSCETSIRIVENTLQMARQQPQEIVSVSLIDVARRIVELKGYDLRRDGVSVQLDFPADLPPLAAAPFRLEQVLLNLVTNAQDALRGRPAPKIIAIVGSTEPGYAVVEVRDTGSGIAPEALPRIFEPFYTTKPMGTGLGLAISSGIVADLGGELTATNGPQGGAVFRMRLPVTKAEEPAGI